MEITKTDCRIQTLYIRHIEEIYYRRHPLENKKHTALKANIYIA